MRHLLDRLPDGSERGQDGPAFVIVVEPDHRHVFGHEDAARLERFERAARHVVAHGNDRVEVQLGRRPRVSRKSAMAIGPSLRSHLVWPEMSSAARGRP